MDNKYRLPTHLKPFSYEIFLKANFNVFTQPEFYEGHVRINFTCLNNTSKLILHKAKDLKILNDTLELISLTAQVSNFKSITNLNWFYDERLEFLVFDLKKDFFTNNNNYSIKIGFKRFFKDDNSNLGFYRNFYIDSNGTKRFVP
jgi:hypothetical protein